MLRTTWLSRRGFTSQFGKMRNLGTLRLGADTDEILRARAARVGLGPMEFVRNFLEQGLHGRSAIEREQTLRLDAIEAVLPPQHRKEPKE